MKELLEQIMKRIQSQVPSLRWIDMNMGQMDTENPPVDYPCALVDITNVDWTTMMNGGQQRGKATVEVELYFVVRQPTNTSAPEHIRSQAMVFFDIVQEVNRALHGFRGENFSPMVRVSSQKRKEYYPRPVVLTYTCNVSD